MFLLRKELIDDFHPVYFVASLGTGITGNIFYGFPYPGKWLEVIGIIFFCLTVALFLLANVMLVVACYYHPQRIYRYHTDPTLSVFLLCIQCHLTRLSMESTWSHGIDTQYLCGAYGGLGLQLHFIMHLFYSFVFLVKAK